VGFHALGTMAAVVVAPRPDVILCPSPPLTVGVSAWLVGLVRRCPFVYNVQEIYPDIAINLGALKSRPVIWVLKGLERWVYRRATAITVIAPRMLENLVRKGVPREKLRVIPNFVDTEDLHPAPKSNDFSRSLGISEKFVLTYAGNLGPAQGLTTMVEAADLLRAIPDIHFLIIGGGTSEKDLSGIVERLRLPNLTLLPYHPYSMMLQIYAASDLCLVPQALETGSDAVPSKIYRIMACARAVLAVTEPTSDLARLVLDSGCGISVRPNDPAELATVIERLCQVRLRCSEMGIAGRTFVLGVGSRSRVTSQYHELLCDVASRKTISITA
jgi:colanic acid biosynthesis glycosyl transferase WcaI